MRKNFKEVSFFILFLFFEFLGNLAYALSDTLLDKNIEQSERIFSTWNIKNKGEESYLYDSSGFLCTGKTPLNKLFNWRMISSGEFVIIKNDSTNRNISLIKENESYDLTLEVNHEKLNKWQIGGYNYNSKSNCGWYWIRNSFEGNIYISMRNRSTIINFLEEGGAFKDNEQWSFFRIDGSVLPYEIKDNQVIEESFLGLRKATAVSTTSIKSDYPYSKKFWKQEMDISTFPVLSTPNNSLLSALYNLSLEETLKDIRKEDSTFMAGKLWPETWTRDAVYSIFLVYSMILPEISRKTLEKQSLGDMKEALQDTGSGGSWPISTDRVSWAMAAWEYYLATGDKSWLKKAYKLLKYTAEKDLHVVFDHNVNLFKGETCSMDWRTHTYPSWFSNVQIGESFSTGTNSLHAYLYSFLVKAGSILNKSENEIKKWEVVYNRLKKGINEQLWLQESGYYSSYLLPNNFGYNKSFRASCMDNGLAILTEIADSIRGYRITTNFPVSPYGAPTLFPSIPDGYAYHNKSIWPVWETFFMLGAKKVENYRAVEHIVKSLIRATALFVTNKENLNYDTGFNSNTALNSDRQLWSVASYLGMIYKVIFGIEFKENGLQFKPFVPQFITGPIILNGFKYRDATLDIEMNGYGNEIDSVYVDGKLEQNSFTFSSDMQGTHKIKIILKKNAIKGSINLFNLGIDSDWTPKEPAITLVKDQIIWNEMDSLRYFIPNKNDTITSPYKIDLGKFNVYNMYAIASNRLKSDPSNPIFIEPNFEIYEAEENKVDSVFIKRNIAGYSGSGYVVDQAVSPSKLSFHFTIPKQKSYKYYIQLRGANGNGPDGSFACIRSVFLDDNDIGTFIFEANGNWNNWTNSNLILLNDVSSGEHTLDIRFNPESKGYDDNMSKYVGNLNDCIIDYLRVIQVKDEKNDAKFKLR